MNAGKRTDIFEGREGMLKVTANADWKYDVSLMATGDSRLGKGVLGAIPLHLIFESNGLLLKKRSKGGLGNHFGINKINATY